MTNESINNSVLIAGIFREAILINALISMEDRNIAGQIVNLHETNDRRDKSVNRTIEVKFQKAINQVSGEYKSRIYFEKFIVEANLILANQIDSTTYIFSCPKEIRLSNRRVDVRKSTSSLYSMKNYVLVTGQDFDLEGLFNIQNISTNGFAGEISFVTKVDELNISGIKGYLTSSSGFISLNGKIVKISFLRNQDGRFYYDVRCERRKDDFFKTESRNDQRKSARFDGSIQRTFRSVLNNSVPINLSLKNFSISGFSAVIHNKLIWDLIVIGVSLSLDSSTMKAEVLATDQKNRVIRCKWIIGNEEDRLIWLKDITPYIKPNIEMDLGDANELFALFCEAGAFSAEFINREKPFQKESLRNIEEDNRRNSYQYRWINTGHDGDLKGQYNAIRSGENSWIAGDFVGSPRADSKIDKDFVNKFFNSFATFCLNIKPCPKIFMIWLKDHKYWSDVESFFSSEIESIISKNSIGYYRFARDELKGNFKLDMQEIHAGEFSKINSIRSILKKNNTMEVASAFDFDIDRYGSPRMENNISSNGQIFERRYFQIFGKNLDLLGIVTKFPKGVNQNRLLDAVWLFDTGSKFDNAEEWEHICQAMRKNLLPLGFSPSSVRRVVDYSHRKLEQEHAVLTCYLAHPQLLLNIKGKK